MRRRVLNVVAFFAPLALVIGCGDKKAEVPTNLQQPLPKATGSAGGPAPDKTGGAAVGGGHKKGPPGASAD